MLLALNGFAADSSSPHDIGGGAAGAGGKVGAVIMLLPIFAVARSGLRAGPQ